MALKKIAQPYPTTTPDTADDVEIGSDDYLGDFFNGSIDEVAIWNRTLSADEILYVYNMGVMRLNLSVRSCDDSACSGESFTDIDDVSPQNLSVSDNRYFQYFV